MGKPQLNELIAAGMLSVSGSLFLKYKDVVYEARLNEDGKIVYNGKMTFESPSAFGMYLYNLGNEKSSGRLKQCAGWHSVKYSDDNTYATSKALRFFQGQVFVFWEKTKMYNSQR